MRIGKKRRRKKKKRNNVLSCFDYYTDYYIKIDIAIVESREEMKLYCGINFVEQNLLVGN